LPIHRSRLLTRCKKRWCHGYDVPREGESQHAQGLRGAEIPTKIRWNLRPTKARSPSTFSGVLNVLQISRSETMRTCVLNPAGPSSNSGDWELILLSFLLQNSMLLWATRSASGIHPHHDRINFCVQSTPPRPPPLLVSRQPPPLL